MTPSFKKILLVGALGALGTLSLSTTSFADDAQSARNLEIQQRFAAADKNHDGKLTLEEAKAGMPRVASHFDVIDADHKGYVTVAEIEAMAAR